MGANYHSFCAYYGFLRHVPSPYLLRVSPLRHALPSMFFGFLPHAIPLRFTGFSPPPCPSPYVLRVFPPCPNSLFFAAGFFNIFNLLYSAAGSAASSL